VGLRALKFQGCLQGLGAGLRPLLGFAHPSGAASFEIPGLPAGLGRWAAAFARVCAPPGAVSLVKACAPFGPRP